MDKVTWPGVRECVGIVKNTKRKNRGSLSPPPARTRRVVAKSSERRRGSTGFGGEARARERRAAKEAGIDGI
jgi:hypothetical protein